MTRTLNAEISVAAKLVKTIRSVSRARLIVERSEQGPAKKAKTVAAAKKK